MSDHFSAGFPHAVAVFCNPAFERIRTGGSVYVCPASEFHQIVIERRMVLCQKHQFDLAARQASAAVLGAQSASQKLGESSNGDRCSATNSVALPGLQS